MDFRILQEDATSGFAPCRNVLIKDNRITFRRSQVQTDINIGGGNRAGDIPLRKQPLDRRRQTAGIQAHLTGGGKGRRLWPGQWQRQVTCRKS
jgi:hypothetical protein